MDEPWVQEPIPIAEFLSLFAYLGSTTFLVGIVLFVVVCIKIVGGKRRMLKISLLSVSRLLVSVVLSVVIWALWPAGYDIMAGFWLVPGVVSEIITITAWWSIMKIKRKNI